MIFALSMALISGAFAERMPVHLFAPRGGEVFLTQEEAEEARRRYTEEAWAKPVGDQLIARAESLATARLRVPAAPGQWMHWYTCKVEGARLVAHSPTDHRCPVCGATYTGWPYDEVYNTMRHNFWLLGVETLGWAYTLTGEPRYAQRVREILLEYGAFYKDLEIHNTAGKRVITGGRLYAQTLEEAIALCSITIGYDRVYKDPCFRKPDHEEIERELLRPMIRTIHKYNPGVSNWQSWHNAAVGSAALLLGDAELAGWTINGKTGFLFQMDECVLPGGMWYEEAPQYHFYALRALVYHMEAAARAGIPIYRHPKTLLLFEAPLRHVLPDLTLPPINDSDRVSLKNYRPYYEIAYRRYRHPKFAVVCDPRDSVEALFWGMNALPDVEDELNLVSSNEVDEGLGILRNEENTMAVLLDYGSGKSQHAHPARLGLLLYAHDDLRLLDPGLVAYGNPLHASWYATTLAHNTVVVNQESQKRTAAELIHFSADDWGGQMAARCDDAYPGVGLERWSILYKNVLLDVFRCHASSSAVFDLPLHLRGEMANLPAREPAPPLGASAGYDKLQDLQRCQEALERFDLRTGAETRVHVELLRGGNQAWTAEAYGASPQELVPMVLLRQEGTAAIFATALHMLSGAEQPLEVDWREDEGMFIIEGKRLFLEGWAAGEVLAEQQEEADAG